MGTFTTKDGKTITLPDRKPKAPAEKPAEAGGSSSSSSGGSSSSSSSSSGAGGTIAGIAVGLLVLVAGAFGLRAILRRTRGELARQDPAPAPALAAVPDPEPDPDPGAGVFP